MNLMVWNHVGAVLQELLSVGSPHWISLRRTKYCGKDAGAREEYEEEGSAETKCYELTAAPVPHTPEPFRMRRSKMRGGRKVFSACFLFLLLYNVFNWQ